MRKITAVFRKDDAQNAGPVSAREKRGGRGAEARPTRGESRHRKLCFQPTLHMLKRELIQGFVQKTATRVWRRAAEPRGIGVARVKRGPGGRAAAQPNGAETHQREEVGVAVLEAGAVGVARHGGGAPRRARHLQNGRKPDTRRPPATIDPRPIGPPIATIHRTDA